MPSRGALAGQGWRFFYEQAPLLKRDKLREPLRFSIPHARNFVSSLSMIASSIAKHLELELWQY